MTSEMRMGRLEGKIAVITGAARGQGRAEAERFVAEGASVVLTDVLASVHEVAAGLGSRALAVQHDVTSQAQWEAVVATTVAEFGGIDVLVNNAGVYATRPLLDTSEDDLRRILDINLVGAWLGIKVVAPRLVDRGGGSIVNVASLAGVKAAPGASSYTMSKFAVRGLTKAAASELGPFGVRVNAILPGAIRTDMIADVLSTNAGEASIAGRLPLRRIGEPADVAELALFLASDESRFITGADHVIDGGSTA